MCLTRCCCGPLPVPNAPRLVTMTRWIENSSSESFSYPQIRALADRPDLFASLCGIGGATLFTGPPDALEPVGAALVSGKYFETLGLTPFAGRLLSDGDDQPGGRARGGHYPQLLVAPFRR